MTALEVKNLCLHKKGQKILKQVQFSLPLNQLVAIIGPNGSGKSTLLKCLAGLEKCKYTNLHFQQQEITNLERSERSQLISWCPEKFHLPFDFSVEEVIMMGLYPWNQGIPRKKDLSSVEKMIDFFSLCEKKNLRMNLLSSGEQRRTLLAQTLIGGNPLILLDEPTANLDIEWTLGFLSHLKKLSCMNRVICVSIHDLSQVYDFFTYVIIMNYGRIIEFGLTKQVLRPDLIKKVFGVESHVTPVLGKNRLILV